LKLGSRKFWPFASWVAMLSSIPLASGLANSKRANELMLAGLRPGHDKIVTPQKSFRELERDQSVTDALLWGDICTHRELRVEADANGGGVVKTVSVASKYKPEIMAKCAASVMDPKRLKLIASGHGLQLGDACGRIEEMYGKAESRSPSVAGSDKLELYLYKFDWAGTDVPQVMEVSCDSSSQTVAEITLAAATL